MSSYEVDEYYEEIIKGCSKVVPDQQTLIKEVIELTLALHRDKLYQDAKDQASQTPLFKY